MDKKIRDVIVSDGVNNCKHILSDKEEFSMLNDGKLFFKGCIEGFELSKQLICLEQFEQFIISCMNKETYLRTTSDKHDDYIITLGKRCALEFIYNNLQNIPPEPLISDF